MNVVVKLTAGPSGFLEDKDAAREQRIEKILPALDRLEPVTIDFDSVSYATQSFVHALVGEALRKHGERALDLIEFRNCSPQIRSIIELVVDYSLGGFSVSSVAEG